MNDEQTLKYTRRIVSVILNGLNETDEAISIAPMIDKDNQYLLAHLKGLIALFEKTIKIIEGGNNE